MSPLSHRLVLLCRVQGSEQIHQDVFSPRLKDRLLLFLQKACYLADEGYNMYRSGAGCLWDSGSGDLGLISGVAASSSCNLVHTGTGAALAWMHLSTEILSMCALKVLHFRISLLHLWAINIVWAIGRLNSLETVPRRSRGKCLISTKSGI